MWRRRWRCAALLREQAVDAPPRDVIVFLCSANDARELIVYLSVTIMGLTRVI